MMRVMVGNDRLQDATHRHSSRYTTGSLRCNLWIDHCRPANSSRAITTELAAAGLIYVGCLRSCVRWLGGGGDP